MMILVSNPPRAPGRCVVSKKFKVNSHSEYGKHGKWRFDLRFFLLGRKGTIKFPFALAAYRERG